MLIFIIILAIAVVICVGIAILINETKDSKWINERATIISIMQTNSSSFGVEQANISFQRNGDTVYSHIGGLSAGQHNLYSGLEVNIRYKANRFFGTDFYKCYLEDDADEITQAGRKTALFVGTAMILVGIGSVVVLIFVVL